MTRQAFDAVLKRVADRLPPLEAHHRRELWCAFNGVGAHTPAPAPPRTHWTPEALALLKPLRIEIATCQHAAKKGTIERRYADLKVTLPGRGRGRAPLVIDVLDAFDLYRIELKRIKTEMEDALTEGNHKRFATVQGQPPPEDIAIIVENERAANTKQHRRYAGTEHWTQWALPGLKKQLTEIFEQAREQTPQRGRVWIPYPNSLKGTP